MILYTSFCKHMRLLLIQRLKVITENRVFARCAVVHSHFGHQGESKSGLSPVRAVTLLKAAIAYGIQLVD